VITCSGIWDVDLESWIEIQNAEHRDVMGSLLEPVIPIGYSGRSGAQVGSNENDGISLKNTHTNAWIDR
jgi:hypothetical protein